MLNTSHRETESWKSYVKRCGGANEKRLIVGQLEFQKEKIEKIRQC